MPLQFVVTEVPRALPYSPALEIARLLADDGQGELTVLPRRRAAIERLDLEVFDRQGPVLVLGNALNNLELLLYRYAANEWFEVGDEDDAASPGGEVVPGAPRMVISPAEIFAAHQAWGSVSHDAAHVTVSMGAADDFEGALTFRLVHEGFRAGQVGVPPLEEGDRLRDPGLVARTVSFLAPALFPPSHP